MVKGREREGKVHELETAFFFQRLVLPPFWPVLASLPRVTSCRFAAVFPVQFLALKSLPIPALTQVDISESGAMVAGKVHSYPQNLKAIKILVAAK